MSKSVERFDPQFGWGKSKKVTDSHTKDVAVNTGLELPFSQPVIVHIKTPKRHFLARNRVIAVVH